MSKFGNCFAALGAVVVLGFSSAAGSDTGRDLIEKAAPSSSARDYRAASATALRVASARSQVGETADACAALSQSLESYRKALAQETGDNEPAASSINDDSDGMADVRARFGCKR
jgi:hypothetical protein